MRAAARYILLIITAALLVIVCGCRTLEKRSQGAIVDPFEEPADSLWLAVNDWGNL